MIRILFSAAERAWLCRLDNSEDVYYGVSALDALKEMLGGYASAALTDDPSARGTASDLTCEEVAS